MNNKKYFYATGKRKTSIARIFLKNGNGKIEINKKSDYFKNKKLINIIKKPLYLLNIADKIDIVTTTKGGGQVSQAEAIKHGISVALVKLEKYKNDKSTDYKEKLKGIGYLTRDSRKVERKKVGRKKSRKREQYSKR